jgi:excisionase family DNA binding protein
MQEEKVNPGNELIMKLLHSKKEAALMLDVSPRTIDNLIAFKELQVRRIGRRVLIPHTALINFVRTDHRLERAA